MFRVLSLIFLCFYGTLLARIVHIDTIKLFDSVVGEIDKESLVLFDVDYTLIMPKDIILGPKGKKFYRQLVAELSLEDKYSEDYLLGTVLATTPFVPVEPEFIDLIEELKKNRTPALAFTAANTGKIGPIESFSDFRIHQLETLGFDFRLTTPIEDTFTFLKDRDKKHYPLFRSGILFASQHPKGEVLKQFLEKTGLLPKKVVFIDDNMSFIS